MTIAKPTGFKLMVILGIATEAFCLAVIPPIFFLAPEELGPIETGLLFVSIPVFLIAIFGCIQLLYKKILGLWVVRCTLCFSLLVEFICIIEDLFTSNFEEVAFGIVGLFINTAILTYWSSSRHGVYLRSE